MSCTRPGCPNTAKYQLRWIGHLDVTEARCEPHAVGWVTARKSGKAADGSRFSWIEVGQ